ncbi:MAG: hypothetical protein P1U86_05620 [Verrucomicrobiales bacterium]|nr:hypothetical protein [Verrucomicrobiales bacterium]
MAETDSEEKGLSMLSGQLFFGPTYDNMIGELQFLVVSPVELQDQW